MRRRSMVFGLFIPVLVLLPFGFGALAGVSVVVFAALNLRWPTDWIRDVADQEDQDTCWHLFSRCRRSPDSSLAWRGWPPSSRRHCAQR